MMISSLTQQLARVSLVSSTGSCSNVTRNIIIRRSSSTLCSSNSSNSLLNNNTTTNTTLNNGTGTSMLLPSNNNINNNNNAYNLISIRTITKKKKLKKKLKKIQEEVKLRAKLKAEGGGLEASTSTTSTNSKTTTTTTDDTSTSSSRGEGENNNNNNNILQEEWVKLQKNIKVDGFDTGQIMKSVRSGLINKKSRGGKKIRKTQEKKLQLQQTASDRERMLSDLGGGQFPPLRYKDVETEQLLQTAYSLIPVKTGKRGSREKKRQKVLQKRIRRARYIKKQEKINAHYRKMEKRSKTVKQVLYIKDNASIVVNREKEYQNNVLKRYVNIIFTDFINNNDNNATKAKVTAALTDGTTAATTTKDTQ